MYSREKIIEKF